MPIINFFKKILTRRRPMTNHSLEAHSIPRAQHQVSKTEIGENALRVINHLNHHGYQTYLVGGSVRDLLLRQVPKDFDVATNATPTQIKKLFRNARIIGRRFKLVHITFHREIIEVSTFRANSPEQHLQTNAQGILIRDNVYGNIEDDAWRRDFTVNSLYYDVKSGAIIDFTQGFQDVTLRQIRMIGDPLQRYQEDPVRMLRAIRFAAKLDFSIATETAAAIHEMHHLIEHVSNARLFDELNKIFQCQHALKAFKLLMEFQIFPKLFPLTHLCLQEQRQTLNFLELALENTDHRVKEQKPTTPAFIYAVLLWFPMRHLCIQLQQHCDPLSALEQAINQTIVEQNKIIAVPRRYTQVIREIWLLQYRFPKRIGTKPFAVLQHPRFRAAYDFLALRAIAKDESIELADWWTKFQEVDPEQQQLMIQQLTPPLKPKRRSRKPKDDHAKS